MMDVENYYTKIQLGFFLLFYQKLEAIALDINLTVGKMVVVVQTFSLETT